MASFVSTNAYILVNAIDLSARVKSIDFKYEAEQVDDSAMGDTVRSMLGGVKTMSLSVTFQKDYAASNEDATLFAAIGTQISVALKPVNTTTAATNPQYSSTFLLVSFDPVPASFGEQPTTQAVFAPAGVALTRATS